MFLLKVNSQTIIVSIISLVINYARFIVDVETNDPLMLFSNILVRKNTVLVTRGEQNAKCHRKLK